MTNRHAKNYDYLPPGFDTSSIKLVSTAKLAKLFGVTTMTAWAWIKEGKFGEAVQIKTRWYVKQSEVDRVINERHGS